MQTFDIPAIPNTDPGPCPIDPAVRAARAARLLHVEQRWLAVKNGQGTTYERTAAALGYATFAVFLAPDLLVEEDPPEAE